MNINALQVKGLFDTFNHVPSVSSGRTTDDHDRSQWLRKNDDIEDY